MNIEELQDLIAKYGPSTRLQDLLDKMECDSENLKTILDSPVEGDQIVISYYTWKFSGGKWSSRAWESEFLPGEFRGVANNQRILYVEKMVPR